MTLAAVGRCRGPGIGDAVEEFAKRAARYWPLEVVEVREEPARGASPDLVREREGERLLEKVRGTLVLCDPGGVAHTSEAFAAWMQREREAARDVTFVIGGAFGIGAPLRNRPHQRLALAPWTVPHELARLVLLEQLYRAGTLVRGEPYHK
ncbi:MAG: 23S rRNA (pseudouridine(1915)-N(3))-methyltransferase RlmH [Gemmatimonadaceae bacterium]|nr:23S rRNA (pseudouridine(1915)-N(3))-methyltransferase RlmH [Gemmatimonadaceae bacterium]